jgi:prepilin-type N-terminal cleavage/methylation domain-containing protein
MPGQRGATLLEVLVATMLLAVAAAMVFTAFGVSLRSAALADGLNRAVGLAEETLAVLTAGPCRDPAMVADPARLPPVPPRYRREVLVRPLPGERRRAVTVTVRWTQAGRSRLVTLRTVRTLSRLCEAG